MKSCRYKSGFTLVETLVVIAIIVILAAMVVGITSRINNQAKEKLTENTFAILDAVLQEFHDYGWSYPLPYTDFDFPLDCNDYSQPALETTLKDALGATTVEIVGGNHLPEYSGSEAMYFFLSKVPECRTTLDKVDESLITRKDFSGNEMTLVINGIDYYPLLRIVDPWRQRGTTTKIGKTLRYDYYNEKLIPPDPTTRRNFPVIMSAGPDGIFGNSDDISSR